MDYTHGDRARTDRVGDLRRLHRPPAAGRPRGAAALAPASPLLRPPRWPGNLARGDAAPAPGLVVTGCSARPGSRRRDRTDLHDDDRLRAPARLLAHGADRHVDAGR